MFDHKIYNVADPGDLNDVSNKKYVDDTVVNLNTSVDAKLLKSDIGVYLDKFKSSIEV